MTELRPTRTRLALLADVDRGWCFRLPLVGRLEHARDLNEMAGSITGRIAKMAAAGWVELGPPHPAGRFDRWRLTEAGREILRQNGGTP